MLIVSRITLSYPLSVQIDARSECSACNQPSYFDAAEGKCVGGATLDSARARDVLKRVAKTNIWSGAANISDIAQQTGIGQKTIAQVLYHDGSFFLNGATLEFCYPAEEKAAAIPQWWAIAGGIIGFGCVINVFF
jgi:hypothetical protein